LLSFVGAEQRKAMRSKRGERQKRIISMGAIGGRRGCGNPGEGETVLH
jgi:hypothetical protein